MQEWRGFCCKAPLRAPPDGANRQEFKWNVSAALRSKSIFRSEVIVRSYKTGRSQGPILRESFTFTRLSMLIGPIMRMVEPPGIAPGSSPLITWAFIPIAEPKSGTCNIGRRGRHGKGIRTNSVVLMESLPA